MTTQPKEFWQRFQQGVEVAVASTVADKLLGVREAFQQYFRDGLGKAVPVVVVPRESPEPDAALPLTDQGILELAWRRALEEQESRGDSYDFVVGTEAGLLTFQAAGQERTFVRSWTVLLGLNDEAWGSSGSVQLPRRLLTGLDREDFSLAIPGTLRSGGMVGSLTGGLEDRRRATALSTLHALATLMYGLVDARPGRRA